MREFVIYADSACDMSPEILAKWGVPYSSLTFRFDGEDKEYANGDMVSTEFYDRMRKGGVAKTAAVNSEMFREGFEKLALENKDILYLGFSSGLSTTVNSARIAAKEVCEAHPECKILIVDTLSASAGYGLMLRAVLDKKEEGASLEECAKYAESLVLGNCHWFTVDDLVYLKRGGRISPTAAFFGNAMGIKPVMHMDNEGHLVNVNKVRGRRTAVAALADKYTELAVTPDKGRIFISHGDCEADAKLLAKMIEDKHGVKTEIITDVGPVIGAHSGPGTLALFFVGRER